MSADRRSAVGLAAGDDVDVELELDTAPRTVDVPSDLAAALAEPARARFEAMSYSHQRQHVDAVEGAKTEETRRRRIAKAGADLAS